MPESDQAEGSDWINVLNAQEVLLEILIWNAIKTMGLS
jgi:hypothetical protein